jgi:hypothetical protein
MSDQTPSTSSKLAMSLKVAALVTVLGSVVLAAEQRVASHASSAPISAVQTAPVNSSAAPDSAAPYYFPAQFPTPGGEAAEQPPTF